MGADAWSFYHPAKIFSGTKCIENYFRLHAHDKGQVLIITTKGASDRGYLKKIINHIQNDQIYIWDQIKPNPELDRLDKAAHELSYLQPSSIIALGGGSVLDTAKVFSVTLACKEKKALNRHFRQREKLQFGKKINLTAIPTTSGSGAEATPFATVWDSSTYKKHSLNHEILYPEYVLLNPEFTISLPFKQTLYSGLDMISHALESLWNINSSPISQAFAFQALRQADNSFATVLNYPEDMRGRKDMQSASLLSGLAISQTRTAIAHSISYPLTARYNIPHGLACSFTLPELIRSNIRIFKEHGSFSTIQNILDLLNGLNLDIEIMRYAEKDKIMSLATNMINPGRAGNYTGPASIDEISAILEKTLG